MVWIYSSFRENNIECFIFIGIVRLIAELSINFQIVLALRREIVFVHDILK